MKLTSKFLNKLFSKKELQDIQRAVVADKQLLSAIVKIISYRRDQTKSRSDMLDHPNYIHKRTFYDGRESECEWLLEFLTEGETNE